MKTNKTRIILYLYEFISTFILFYAVDTLFYLERGITSSKYLFFVVISYIVQLLFEIPSGVLADKYSKKKILIISQILFIISTIIFIIAQNYIVFIIATIVAGLQKCFGTGIVNSFLYESLENKNKFNKCLFIKNTIYYTAYMLAMPIGGFIAEKLSIVTTYYITLIPAIIGLIVLFFLNENETINVKNNDNITGKLEILKNGLKEINKNSFIKTIIFTNAILLAVIKLVEESHPDYSIQIGITEFQIGIYTSFILVFCIIGSYLGSKIKKKYHNIAIYLNPILTGICILLLGLLNNRIGILFLLVMYIFEESFDNIMLSKVHNSIASKSRVTVESLMSILQCICGIIIGSSISILLNYINVNISYIILGLLTIIYSSLVILFKFINKLKLDSLNTNIDKI
ncbi:MAG: MFS transporter [Clostridia bacterium]|nr:MFS transporter [Clostridia bacterium]